MVFKLVLKKGQFSSSPFCFANYLHSHITNKIFIPQSNHQEDKSTIINNNIQVF